MLHRVEVKFDQNKITLREEFPIKTDLIKLFKMNEARRHIAMKLGETHVPRGARSEETKR